MAKSFKLAQNHTFKHKVSLPRMGGDPLEVEFEFKYLTRSEQATLQDKWKKAAKEMVEKWSNVEDFTTSELLEDEITYNVNQLKDIIVSWEFDEPFDDDNLRELVNATIHTSDVITKAYFEAYSKAKVGN